MLLLAVMVMMVAVVVMLRLLDDDDLVAAVMLAMTGELNDARRLGGQTRCGDRSGDCSGADCANCDKCS